MPRVVMRSVGMTGSAMNARMNSKKMLIVDR